MELGTSSQASMKRGLFKRGSKCVVARAAKQLANNLQKQTVLLERSQKLSYWRCQDP